MSGIEVKNTKIYNFLLCFISTIIFGKSFAQHETVHHTLGEYVKGRFHTNTLEGFWSLFKRGIVGIYHFITPKHMDNYVSEFTYRYNTRYLNDSHRFALVLTNSNNKIKYEQLIK